MRRSLCKAPRPAGIKPLVVLDVNGVLLYREERPGAWPAPDDGAVGSVDGRRMWLRPNALQFIRRILPHVQVALWSTAHPDTLRAMVQIAFPEDIRRAFAFVWDRRWCTPCGPPGRRRNLRKDLTTVWSQPGLGDKYGPTNTLLVDDSPRKIHGNPECSVYVSSRFLPQAAHEPRDDEFLPEGNLCARIGKLDPGGGGHARPTPERRRVAADRTPVLARNLGLV